GPEESTARLQALSRPLKALKRSGSLLTVGLERTHRRQRCGSRLLQLHSLFRRLYGSAAETGFERVREITPTTGAFHCRAGKPGTPLQQIHDLCGATAIETEPAESEEAAECFQIHLLRVPGAVPGVEESKSQRF